jgi:hypothetical protein
MVCSCVQPATMRGQLAPNIPLRVAEGYVRVVRSLAYCRERRFTGVIIRSSPRNIRPDRNRSRFPA